MLYLLESLPKQGLPLWRLVGEAMANRLRGAMAAQDTTVTMGDMDANYGDATRVLRIPGTYNTEARQYAAIIGEADMEPVRYRLDALRDAYLPELLIPDKPGKKRPPSEREKRVRRLYNAYSLHMARLEDIVTLRDLRRAADMPEDCRRRMVFLYRYWSCFSVGRHAALEASLAFNKGFAVPLPASTVEATTRSAEVAYERWTQDSRKGYNYRNATLIQLLGITPEEQKLLRAIISPEEKRRSWRCWISGILLDGRQYLV